MIRFLIDECLSPYLVARAQDYGYEAAHVFRQGMAGWADWRLVAFAVERKLTLVTNNRRDFHRLYGQLAEHSGLMVMLEATRVQRQMPFLAPRWMWSLPGQIWRIPSCRSTRAVL
jgi:predicted nuclease of predicted toxin-antitoxin system